MSNTSSVKRQVPFSFVLEELVSLRPTIKRMFGFTMCTSMTSFSFRFGTASRDPDQTACGYTQQPSTSTAFAASSLNYQDGICGAPEKARG